MSGSSRKLEQTGTEADCTAAGTARYFAWYELVPSGPVSLKLPIAAGDRISASVSVHSNYVTMRLADATAGTATSRRLHFAQPNLSSAEWIAEAPSNCAGICHALPLTDFGSVSFSGAAVRTGNGSAGTISDAGWQAEPIALNEVSGAAGGGGSGVQVLGARGLVTAVPSVLDPTGSAFSVTWGQEQAGTGTGAGRVFPSVGA
jgi:hypothetical protein